MDTSMDIPVAEVARAGDKAVEAVGDIIEHIKQIASAGQGRHTLKMGEPKAGDVLLYKEDFRAAFVMLGYQTHDFKYSGQGKEVITVVVAKDNWSDDTGGNPEVISGGVDQSHVHVKVTAQLNRGFHFTFEVFGRK